MNISIFTLGIAITQSVAASSEFVWYAFLFSIIFFFVAFGVALSNARKRSKSRNYISRRNLLGACGVLGFLIGSFVVQVAASAFCLAFFDVLFGGGFAFVGLAACIVVLVWGLLVLSSSISGYFKKTLVPFGAIITGTTVALLALTNIFGFQDFSFYASISFQVSSLPKMTFPVLALISLATSGGIILAYVPKKLRVSISVHSMTMQVDESQMLTSVASGGTAPYRHQWFEGNQEIYGATQSSYSYSATNPGSMGFYVVVTDSASPAVVTKSRTVNLKVVPAPLSAPVVASSTSALDMGQDILISQIKTAQGGVAPYSQQWFMMEGKGSFNPIKGADGNFYRYKTETVAASVNRSFRLQVVDSKGSTVTSNAVSVKVNPLPKVTIDAKSLTLKAGEKRRFGCSVSGGTEPFDYRWFEGDKSITGAIASDCDFGSERLGDTAVYVVVTDSGSPRVSAKSNLVSIKILPVPLAAPVVIASHPSLDLGQSTQLKQSKRVFGGIVPFKYQWYTKETNVSFEAIVGAVEEIYEFKTTAATPLGSRSFRLQVIDSAGSAVLSNVVSVIVNPAPTVSVSPEKLTVSVGQRQSLIASASGGTGNYEYQWYVNGRRVGLNSKTHTFSSEVTGLFKVYVKLTDSSPNPTAVQSNTCLISTCYLPKSFGEIIESLHDGDLDKVIGFNLIDFVGNTESEADFQVQLGIMRENREDWCEKNGFDEKVDGAINTAYHDLSGGQRNLVYVRRIVEALYVEWKLTRPEEAEVRHACTGEILKSFENDVDVPWEQPNIPQLKGKVKERILDQNALGIGIKLFNEDRVEDSLYFSREAVRRTNADTGKSLMANELLGRALFTLNRYGEALPYLKRLVEMRNQEDDYRYVIKALIEEKDYYEAKRYGEKLGQKFGFKLALDCYNHATALVFLKEFLAARLYASKGVELAQDALRANPKDDINRRMLQELKELNSALERAGGGYSNP